MKIKVTEFEAEFRIVQAFGVIGGAHIPIMAPPTNSQGYKSINTFLYKYYTTINLFTHLMFKLFVITVVYF